MCEDVSACEKPDTSPWEVGFYVDTFSERSSRTAHTRFVLLCVQWLARPRLLLEVIFLLMFCFREVRLGF